MLLSSSLSNTYYGIRPNTGQTAWEINNLSSLVTSQAQLTSDAYRAFILENDGIVRMIDPFTGNTKWKFNANIQNGKLLADFAISDDQILYLGDTEGKILALRFAIPPPTISPQPTPTPTPRPTIDKKSLIPDSYNDAKGVNSFATRPPPNTNSSYVGYIVLLSICVCLCILL